jgi:hypothetical protein
MLDKFIESAEVQPILSKYFVLTVLEVGNESISNPGTIEYDDKYGGHGQGTPYIAILDAKGNLIINARANGKENIGFPRDKEDVDWFMTMLKKGAPKMTAAERDTIDKKLRGKS